MPKCFSRPSLTEASDRSCFELAKYRRKACDVYNIEEYRDRIILPIEDCNLMIKACSSGACKFRPNSTGQRATGMEVQSAILVGNFQVWKQSAFSSGVWKVPCEFVVVLEAMPS